MSSVKVKLLYFGAAGDITGKRGERVTLVKGSVGQLLDMLEGRYAGLEDLRRSSRVAVDQELVDEEFELNGGETVALLPPVAGG